MRTINVTDHPTLPELMRRRASILATVKGLQKQLKPIEGRMRELLGKPTEGEQVSILSPDHVAVYHVRTSQSWDSDKLKDALGDAAPDYKKAPKVSWVRKA